MAPNCRPGSPAVTSICTCRRDVVASTRCAETRRTGAVTGSRSARFPSGGGGSLEMHALAVGDTVTVRGPRNGFRSFPIRGRLYLAGGIGITPILPMVRAAQRLGTDWHFVYCGRSADTIPFLDEIASGGTPSRVTVLLDEERGCPAAEDLLRQAPEVGGVLRLRAPADDRDRFGTDSAKPVPPHCISNGSVPRRWSTVARSRSSWRAPVRSCRWRPTRRCCRHWSRRGPTPPIHAVRGSVERCRVGVLAGTPEHRENRLTAEERETSMLACVSRSLTSRLTLDV